MRDVIIIGGGLTGLAAAWELERQQTPYTLIEVKPRLGGSVITRRLGGFVLDGGAFAFPLAADWSFLPALGLDDALFEVAAGRQVAFKDGTQQVIDTLAAALRGDIMLRMAVSSLGRSGDSFGVCLENGLLLNARALIVAAPARYAEHLFRTLQPEVSLRLLDYGYDTITRVSLGFPREVIADQGRRQWDMGLPFYYEVDHAARVPEGTALVHLGVRFPLARTTAETLVETLHRQFGWEVPPLVQRVDYWPEADPIPPHTPGYREAMAALKSLLPGGVWLVGSDYDGLGLGERIAAGRDAARQAAAWLRAARR